jgi:protein SCO1/2
MSKPTPRTSRQTLAVVISAVLGASAVTVTAQGLSAGAAHDHDHHMMDAATAAQPVGGHDQHAGHQAAARQHEGHEQHAAMLSQKGYLRSEANYLVPDVLLTNQDGERVSLRQLLAGPKPVLLNYIFTSCTTICPVLSASFAQTQRSLGDEADKVRLVSISIDPEHDTPARLHDYAQRFRAAEGWELLTGSREDIVAVQKAFNAFRGDKMNHIPVTFIHVADDSPWIRLEGFPSAEELVGEYRSQMKQSRASAAQTGSVAVADAAGS